MYLLIIHYQHPLPTRKPCLPCASLTLVSEICCTCAMLVVIPGQTLGWGGASFANHGDVIRFGIGLSPQGEPASLNFLLRDGNMLVYPRHSSQLDSRGQTYLPSLGQRLLFLLPLLLLCKEPPRFSDCHFSSRTPAEHPCIVTASPRSVRNAETPGLFDFPHVGLRKVRRTPAHHKGQGAKTMS